MEQNSLKSVYAGDRRAQEQFVAQHIHLIYAVVGKVVPETEREDAVGEFFLYLWGKDQRLLKTWKEKSKLSTYLGVCAHRFAVEYNRQCRKRRRQETLLYWEDSMVDIPDPADALGSSLLRAEIERVLAAMSPRDRNLLVYRYYYQLSSHEIAARLGMSVGNVDVAMSRAEERFRKRLQPWNAW